MADIFNEIEEDIRQDRAKVAWKKYGKYVIGLAVLIIAITAGNTGWVEYKKSVLIDQSDRFVAAIAKVDANDDVAATDLFAKLSEDSGVGYSMLSRFNLASLKIKSGDIDGAILIYQLLSNDNSIDKIYRDLAVILSVVNQIDDGNNKDLLTSLSPQLQEDAPWRFSAYELAAIITIKMGDIEQAKQYLTLITDDFAAPQAIRARAAERLKITNNNN